MSETRFVGREEKAVLRKAIDLHAGDLAFLSNKSLSGSPDAVIFLTELVLQALEAKVAKMEEEGNRQERVAREQRLNVPRWQFHKDAVQARRDRDGYLKALEDARAIDAKWAAEHPKPVAAAG